MATQAIPQWQLWGQDPRVFRKTRGFVEKWRISEKSGRFQKKVADLRQTRRSQVWGGSWRIFPKSACAADAAFMAKQLKVAIPGWLR